MTESAQYPVIDLTGSDDEDINLPRSIHGLPSIAPPSAYAVRPRATIPTPSRTFVSARVPRSVQPENKPLSTTHRDPSYDSEHVSKKRRTTTDVNFKKEFENMSIRAQHLASASKLQPSNFQQSHPIPKVSQLSTQEISSDEEDEADDPATARLKLEARRKIYLNRALTHQVFPIINRILDGISSITREEKGRIGQIAAGLLVAPPDFMVDFQSHNMTLSAGYEAILARRAEGVANECVEECLRRRQASGESIAEGTGGGGSGEEKEEEEADGAHRGRGSSSGGSREDVEVFERISRPATIRSSKTRDYSSSPATSLSTDHEGRKDTKSQGSRKSMRNQKNPTRPIVVVTSSTTNLTRPEGTSTSGKPKVKLGTATSQMHPDTSREDLRPYVSVEQREMRIRRSRQHNPADHIDFITEEIKQIGNIVKTAHIGFRSLLSDDPTRQLCTLMAACAPTEVARLASLVYKRVRSPGSDLGSKLLHHRGEEAIAEYLGDAANGKLITSEAFATRTSQSAYSLSRILRDRETFAISRLPSQRGHPLFKMQAMSILEDSLTPTTQWTDCCGDIVVLNWTSDSSFICGATAHSDLHNMQYNKPGNLSVGSLPLDELRAVPDHRIPRPLVDLGENKENALDAMRETQDSWLYTSVVSAAYSEAIGLTFTASFDKTVKVWQVSPDGSSMKLLATWEHENKVNFVVTSKHHDRVATAADVSDKAIRVYNLDQNNIEESPFDTYSGERAKEQAQELRGRDTWAYFPAAISWGSYESTMSLLLVGYSPRSITGDDLDIPEDKRNTGELCLFDIEGEKIQIPSARSQNVFEVLWHPSQPCFLASTSPGGAYDFITRTQIRVFVQTPGEGYHFIQVKTLDCSALDINELTVMPNSPSYNYVTASCTDGNTYVWDTAQGDKPIHVLNHGESLDNPLPDLPREIGDAGVKFASWGQSADRFYTGSTDGKVKAWDVRAPPGKAFVRNVLEVSGGISSGKFSKDFSNLLIGDATGKVHLLSYDDSDLVEETAKTALYLRSNCISAPTSKRPKPIIQYTDPSAATEEDMGVSLARSYLAEKQLIIHHDPRIGVVQGPKYTDTILFSLKAHEENDWTLPLKNEFLVNQQFYNGPKPRPELIVDRCPAIEPNYHPQMHAQNIQKDRVLEQAVKEAGGESRWDYHHRLEPTPRFAKIFH